MTCLKIHRPALSEVEPTLKKVRSLIAADLEDLLDGDDAGEIRVTTTIQDGVAQNHAVEVQSIKDFTETIKWDPPTKALPIRAAEALAAGMHELKPRLQSSLVPEYYGFTLLQIRTAGKALHSVICVCKRNYRVLGARVPT